MTSLAADLRAALLPARFCPHEPTPKQAAFLALPNLEALYGGAAGGGKSDALLMAALEYAHVPGYAALILRRKYTDLAQPKAIMDRALEWLHGRVPWNDRDKRFTFPSGATLSFGYCDSKNDLRNYQGAEVQYLGIDELTQWPEQWYRHLLSRVRRPLGLPVPLRARAGTNPGDIGHAWVMRRFIDPETREDRAFVPSTLEDNPHLDVEAYRVSLAQLDSATRAQLEKGLWVRDPGGLVYADYDAERNLVAEAPALDHHILAIDFGVTNACAFVVGGWRKNDPAVYVVHSEKHSGMSPSDAAEHVKGTDTKPGLVSRWRFNRIVGDVGGLGKAFAQEMRTRHAIPIEPADKTNKRGFISLFNGELARRRIVLVKGATLGLQAEWLELPWDETRTKECAGFANHEADGALYGWRACVAYHNRAPASLPQPGTEAFAEAEAKRLEDHNVRLHERRESGSDGDWMDQGAAVDDLMG